MPNSPAPPMLMHSSLVKQSHLFSSLPDALLKEMSESFRSEALDKKSYLDQNSLFSRFYILLEGRVELSRTNPETGRTVTLDLLHPGDGFDVITLLDGNAHDVSVSPIENVRLISVPMEKMRSWLWKYPELNQQFMPYLAKKMRDQEDKTTDFALYDTITRLSRIILNNMKCIDCFDESKQGNNKYLVEGLSDEMLARMAGSVRQVVNQHLQHWKKSGVIDKERNKILVNDLEAIKQDAGYYIETFAEK